VAETYTIDDDVTFGRLCASALRKCVRGQLPVNKTMNLYKAADAKENGKQYAGLIEIAITVKILREIKK